MSGGTSREEEGSAQGRKEREWILPDAVLRVAGREGYENTSVQSVCRAAGISRVSFYQWFPSLEECFRAAYQRKATDLCEMMLAAGRGGDGWADGLRRALRFLLEFVAEQPLTAKVLILDGAAVDGRTAEIQDSIFRRLARALDSARRQPGSRHSAPPLTGDLVVGAITNTLQGLIVKGESARAPQLLGDYTYLVMLAFFDEEVAFEEMDSAQEGD